MRTCGPWLTIGVFALLLALPATDALAQPAAASFDTTQPSGGPLVIERVKSGFVIAPDYKATEVDGRFGNLVGGYGGVLLVEVLLLGGGGYWLANNHDDLEMAYGGLVVGWLIREDRAVGFGARALVGAGEATLGSEYTLRVPAGLDRPGGSIRFGSRSVSMPGGTTTIVRQVIFSEAFFVFEPQADVSVRLTEWLRCSAGVGYRVIGSAQGVEDRLRGVTGTVSIRFGGGS
jgi:hypothetical protein